MLYHYTFNTYKGKQSLIDKNIQHFLKNIFLKIAENRGFEIKECAILSDHVHLLINQSYTMSTSQVMKYMKGISSLELFKNYPSNRQEDRKLWGRGFYAKKVLGNKVKLVSNYIRNQLDSKGEDKRYSRGARL